jgi:hypothetical protein
VPEGWEEWDEMRYHYSTFRGVRLESGVQWVRIGLVCLFFASWNSVFFIAILSAAKFVDSVIMACTCYCYSSAER